MRLQSLVFLCLTVFAASLFAEDAADGEAKKQKKDKSVIQLFDGKTLKGWKSTNFGGEGEVTIKDGNLILEVGSDLTGVTWQDAKSIPKTNYEISFQAMRVDGFDFFCGLTLPIHEGYGSLICGGWGGGVCGLSSIDGFDASENETTSYREFKKGQWYKFRFRVTDEQVNAWIDDKEIFDVEVGDHKFSVRIEVDASKPLGFCTWQTTAALKDIMLRKLTKTDLEKKPAEKTADK
ncbi:MAG: DUF1080 domain-containing protein [Planctomycetota bacterium]|nr:DUF1080 domain-containing protein [Planctomycetota bacterium]MDA1163776.1 DUF1080 domain-containing protein [Planctomycetota bacterium]